MKKTYFLCITELHYVCASMREHPDTFELYHTMFIYNLENKFSVFTLSTL